MLVHRWVMPSMPIVNAQYVSTLVVADSTWAAEEGQDFIADHSSADIDFATIHCWPDNWKVRSDVCKLVRVFALEAFAQAG